MFASSLNDNSPSLLLSPTSHDILEPSAAPDHVRASTSPSSASRPSNESVPALDHTMPISGPDHSIPGLSLPEDSEDGGWQANQKAWIGNLNDDGDDDKSIGQTLKVPEHKSVSVGSCPRIQLTN